MNAGQRATGARRGDDRSRYERAGELVGVAKRAVPPVLRPRLGLFEPQYRPRPLSVPRSYLRATPPNPAPTISIVTPSLNQGEFIAATLASVVAQDYPSLEYIVADGGSQDGTLAVLAGFRDHIDRLESGPDGGHAAAINRELGRAGGEILAWLNSDDLLLPGALPYVARYFLEHPDVDLVYGDRVLIDERGDDIGLWALPGHSPDAVRWVDLVPQETAFWRRALWRRVGGVRDDIEIAFDWDFFRRVEASGARIARLPRFLGAQRQHPDQKTRRFEARSLADQEAIRELGEERPVTDTEIRARLLGYLLRSLPRQYLHLLRARLPTGRYEVELPRARSAPAPPPRRTEDERSIARMSWR